MGVHDNTRLHPSGWVNKYVVIKITKQCKIKFTIDIYFIDQIELDVVSHDVCGLVFGNPYMYMKDEIFMWRDNQ